MAVNITEYVSITPISKRSRYRSWFKTNEECIYECGSIKVIVPVGFTTDYASVPRGLWNIFPPYGKYASAAILHDYLYTKEANISQIVADAIFYDAMKILGVPLWKRTLMFFAVRIFGWIGYHSR